MHPLRSFIYKVCQALKSAGFLWLRRREAFVGGWLVSYFGTTATVQRDTQISFSSSSVMRTSQTITLRPRWSGVPMAVTVPSLLLRTWLAFISRPIASSLSSSTRLKVPTLATVSANTTEAPAVQYSEGLFRGAMDGHCGHDSVFRDLGDLNPDRLHNSVLHVHLIQLWPPVPPVVLTLMGSKDTISLCEPARASPKKRHEKNGGVQALPRLMYREPYTKKAWTPH